MRYLFLSIFIILFSLPGIAQQTDREFAEYYYQQKEFEKAELYFSKLYEEKGGLFYYTRLLTCLEQQESWDKAIELVKDWIKKEQSQTGQEYFDLAILYHKTKDEKQRDKFLEKGLDELKYNRGTVSTVGRKLESAALYRWAKSLYLNAREKDNQYGYHLELAGLYGVQGETKAMVEAYVSLVQENPAYQNSIQSALIRYLSFTEDEDQAELLRQILIERVQKNPDNKSLNELLIWYYYQMSDFAPAFAQVRALDMRYKEGGGRVLDYAQLAARNGEYGAAYRAYDYLLETYKDEKTQLLVLTERAKAAYLELQNIPHTKPEDVARVRDAFDLAVNTLGENPTTASLLIDYADFTLKYGAGENAAMSLLEKVIEMPNLYKKVVALAKLRLGDILLIKGEIWDAALLYGQVDKDFKEDELGSEARLRNAKIAFYTGDFAWAQAQLDILKAATSDLISNDAIELSLLISNNFNLDTVTEPLELYAAADLLIVQNKLDQADSILTKLTNKYPRHSLTDEVYMARYKMAMKGENYDMALSYLKKIIDEHPTDLLGDNALYLMAELYLNKMNNEEEATKLYERILLEFPGSLFSIDARKKYRRLRGDIQFEG
ncbi:tetratricopeptide repeat protein [Luteibaculum oceani]|uniref:Tetratricopeptide repeat protein n=1 Tax=Luteibaculum oceani TaxID=1294296 RepID=A0A5C6V8T2_9FLAO|nr:tetratricopeptide repeat protein [Luteibaculum oceani]TXC81823.1 tetratricopeptide repeat protein [Luteibaculum oceani]